MENIHANNWFAGGVWLLWFGIWFLFISSLGNWGYTYKVHRRFCDGTNKTALDILNERYARGEIEREEFHKMKSEIESKTRDVSNDSKIIR